MENIYRLPYPVNSFNEHYNSSVNMSHKQGFWNINAFQKRLALSFPRSRFIASPKVSHFRSGQTLLNREIFTTLTEAKVLIADWRKEYNQFRRHSSLRYKPPAPEAIMLVTLTL